MKRKHLLVAAAAILFCFAVPAHGVDVYVDKSYSGTVEDGSEARPYKTIQVAINQAIPKIDTVRVKEGTYHELLILRTGVDVVGEGYEKVTIHGANSGQAVCGTGVSNVLVKGFTITAGTGEWGGGIALSDSTVTVQACLIFESSASWGGGICLAESDLTLQDSTVSTNTATLAGAGIAAAGTCTLTMGNTDVRYNTCQGPGGGVYVSTDSAAAIDRCSISYNGALDGGGVYWKLSEGSLRESLVFANTASRDGAAIFIDTADPQITRTRIAANVSTGGYAGGVYFYKSPDAAVCNCIMDGNASWDRGGAIVIEESSPSIINNTIVSNAGYLADGGIVGWEPSAPTILNCIIWNNGDDLDGVTAYYTQVQDGDTGTGNDDADPLFTDPAAGIYTLRDLSPCIDTGHPDPSFNDPDGTRNDRGAYGGPDALPPPAITDLAAEVAMTDLDPVGVTSSGEYSAAYSALMATDGNPATYWNTPFRPAPQPEHLTLDLGAETTIDGVGLLPSSVQPQLFPGDFDVHTSLDGQQWTLAASESGYTPAAGVWYQAEFEAHSARYVRVSTPATPCYQPGLYMTQIAEFAARERCVMLTFTSLGGAEYDVRYSTDGPIETDARWEASVSVQDLPAPQGAGIAEHVPVAPGQLPAETRIHLAVKAVYPTWETSLSNSASVITPGTPPAAVDDLAVTAAAGDSLTISFTAVGDDGTDGTASSYDVRYSTEPVTEDTWSAAHQVAGPPDPAPAGTAESVTIGDLDEDTTYYVALKTKDEVDNESPLSNVAAGKTDDLTPPSAVEDLEAALTATEPFVKLDVAGASSSGEYSASFAATNAIDGNPATYWSTPIRPAPQPEYLVLELGQAENIGKVRFLPSVNPHLFPATFSIELSTDGENWTEAASENEYAAQGGVWYERTLGGQEAQYVRVSTEASRMHQPGVYFLQIAEGEVYSAGGQAVRLKWLAPGDNGDQGTASGYDVRWARSVISDGTWNSSSAVENEPAPEAAGTPQSMTIPLDTFPGGTRIYFALKSADEAGCESGVSNSPFLDMPGEPPAVPGDANRDGCVNILDLVLVRNNINKDPESDGNPDCDVNKDGKINIIDLIAVRNHIGEGCGK